uniref:Uncharacterized protein n=1 Tax=Anguilla anguilla TaxID=7936 RepID=A0A0E9UDX1_ANGAN
MNFPFTTVLEAEREPARLQLHRSYITLHCIALRSVYLASAFNPKRCTISAY